MTFSCVGLRQLTRRMQAHPLRAFTVHQMIGEEPPLPKIFDYQTIRTNLGYTDELIVAVEGALMRISEHKAIVPPPTHIGIQESGEIGPGECFLSSGYLIGTPTWSVRLANASFTRNIDRGLLPRSGLTVVCSAVTGWPLALFDDHGYLTDLRTGAAGAIAVKHLAGRAAHHVAFIGTGSVALAVAQASHCVHRFEYGYAYGLDRVKCQAFANEIHAKLGYRVLVCDSAEEAVRNADVVFTQTASTHPVLDASWLRPQATVIASGADLPSKSELPLELLTNAKLITDLTEQCAQVGELRVVVDAGIKPSNAVYAQLGEIVRGTKAGREESDGRIVADLTGTGAQDAAVGQVAWDTLSRLTVAH